MLARMRRWLKASRHLHLRENRVVDLKSFVELADRFLDGRLEYALEWDDFISWKNDNPNIELIRDRVAALEPLFFAKEPVHRAKAIEGLLAERNQAAAMVAIPARQLSQSLP
jgi:hypothetical protein